MGLVSVVFNNSNKKYCFNDNGLKLKKNLTVIVDTDKGLQFGKVVQFIKNDNYNDSDFNNVVRISTKKDYLQHLNNLKDANKAVDICKNIIASNKLNMSIVDAFYMFDRSQLIFRFVSEERVDFRNLAKELGAIFKTRIELRQVGIRDKAKEIGGIGPCGRLLCCSTFLNDFDSVSINMAKNQLLALNPSKINGLCGRLLCCLKYEDDNYYEYKSGLPHIGQGIGTKDGYGKVISVDIFNRKYKVYVDGVGIVEVGLNDES